VRTIHVAIFATLVVLVSLCVSPKQASALSCAIVGDSIVDDLHAYFRDCRFDTKIGIGSAALVAHVPGNADIVVVSAGSNDYLSPRLIGSLEAVRARAGNARVIWVRPIPRRAAAAVDAVAGRHGDAVVSFAVSPTDRERLHPRSNSALASSIRKQF
jgi:hypothetical protein